MKKMLLRKLMVITLALTLGVFMSGPAQAWLIDTGEGSGTPTALDSVWWLAGEFTLGEQFTITDILGYMNPGFEAPPDGIGLLTYAIYSDGGEIPGTELYSTEYGVTPAVEPDWYGPDGLAWTLDAGTYWVAFEVRDGQNFVGNMPTGAPSALGNEAGHEGYHDGGQWWYTNSGGWFASDGNDIGVRINGYEGPANVPVPAAVWLLGSGLLGLVGLRRRSLG